MKNNGVVATVKKPFEILYLYWCGNLLLEFGIYADEHELRLLEDKLKTN